MLRVRSSRPDIRVALPDGAAILFRSDRPTAGVVAGRRAAGVVVEAGGDSADASVAFTVALAAWGALSWEGVGDEDGQPLELTQESLELLMTEVPEAYRAIDQGFVIPILTRDAEKNVSAPLPVGGTPAAGARKTKAAAKAKKTTSAKRGAGATSARRAPVSATAPKSKTSVPTSATPA
jgi:hypothetical protein